MRKKGKIMVVCIVAIIVIGLIIRNINDRRSLEGNGIYVIGNVDKIDGAYQGVKIFVSYNYKGKLYKNDYVTSSFDKQTMTEGRYFFKIDASNPDKFHIEYLIPVPDSIQTAPYSGWDSLPLKNALY